jgi:hypothetical protein
MSVADESMSDEETTTTPSNVTGSQSLDQLPDQQSELLAEFERRRRVRVALNIQKTVTQKLTF